MHTSVRYNRRIRKKLSEKTDEVVGKDSIGYRRNQLRRPHNTCCACVDQLMGAYSKPTLLADVFINHFATKNTVLFVILPEQPNVKETKKRDATPGDIPL